MIMNGKTPTLISGVPNVALSFAIDEVAGQREPERPGQHVAVGRADRRLAELADQLEQPREALDAEVLVHERHLGREAGEVAARGEDLLVRGGEHDAAHRVVVARRASKASIRSSSSSSLSALRVSGWFRVIVATPSRDVVEDRCVGHDRHGIRVAAQTHGTRPKASRRDVCAARRAGRLKGLAAPAHPA